MSGRVTNQRVTENAEIKMSNISLLFEQRGPVAWLTFNRPEALNAIDLSIIEQFEELIPRLESDTTIRVVVVTGNGRAFCCGADLTQLRDTLEGAVGEPDFLDRITQNVLDRLRVLPKPLIVAINGVSLAGGTEMAMCADIIVAAESAKIGDGHANFGVFPGAGGAALMPRLVPHNVAKYLLLTGRTLSAAEMHGHGFVNLVVPDGELIGTTQALAEEIAAKSPIGLARMKRVANESLNKSRADALADEQVELRRHLRSWDMQEGLTAFAEKRQPNFEGR